MAEKKLYSIGEIAELTDTSGKTLRYYDTIGLLKPGYKNPETLYRYYTKDQVFNVFLIKKLQTLGFSLKEIQSLMALDAPEQYAREVSKKWRTSGSGSTGWSASTRRASCLSTSWR